MHCIIIVIMDKSTQNKKWDKWAKVLINSEFLNDF
jgi:hypothetical protein